MKKAADFSGLSPYQIGVRGARDTAAMSAEPYPPAASTSYILVVNVVGVLLCLGALYSAAGAELRAAARVR